MHLVLEAGLGMQLGLRLRHVGECAIDRRAALVAAQRQVVLHADAALGQLARSRDLGRVVAMLAAVGRAGFLRRGEGVEALVGPVVEHLLEGGSDLRGGEVLQPIDAGFLQRAVVGARVQVHRLIVVDGADHVVEVDPAVEEAPGDIAHQCAQVRADVHRVAHRLAGLGGPADVGEVLVAAEGEAAELEIAVAVRVGGAHRGSSRLKRFGRSRPSVRCSDFPCRSAGSRRRARRSP